MGVRSGFQINLTRDLLYSKQSEAGDTLQDWKKLRWQASNFRINNLSCKICCNLLFLKTKCGIQTFHDSYLHTKPGCSRAANNQLANRELRVTLWGQKSYFRTVAREVPWCNVCSMPYDVIAPSSTLEHPQAPSSTLEHPRAPRAPLSTLEHPQATSGGVVCEEHYF